jgi:phospholipid/cholesterol/gamma-HCH transport system permease protein
MTSSASQSASAPATGAPPTLSLERGEEGATLRLGGTWTLAQVAPRLQALETELGRHAQAPDLAWDLQAVTALDTAAALLLWRAWGHALPERLSLGPRHEALFGVWQAHEARLAATEPTPEPGPATRLVTWLARPARGAMEPARALLLLLGQLVIDTFLLLRHPGRIPWREISATIYVTGFARCRSSAWSAR